VAELSVKEELLIALKAPLFASTLKPKTVAPPDSAYKNPPEGVTNRLLGASPLITPLGNGEPATTVIAKFETLMLHAAISSL
jgi:hypothetical protein